MKYDLTVPCDNCPFRRVGGIRLRPGRVEEVAAYATDRQGAMFACHKTARQRDEEASEDDTRVHNAKSQHCAGALIFAFKQGTMNQAARMAERIGFFDRDDLMKNQQAVDDVFDSTEEMVKAAL